MVSAFVAVAVTVVDPPRLTDDPLMVKDELVNWLLAILPSVPPNVKLPEEVTVPVKVMPLTEPVPLTEVTVPPEPKADKTPPAKVTPEPIATELNPPAPFP